MTQINAVQKTGCFAQSDARAVSVPPGCANEILKP